MAEREPRVPLKSALCLSAVVAPVLVGTAVLSEATGYADLAGLPFQQETVLQEYYPGKADYEYKPNKCESASWRLFTDDPFTINNRDVTFDPESGQAYPVKEVLLRKGNAVHFITGLTKRHYRGGFGEFVSFSPVFGGTDPSAAPFEVSLEAGETVLLDADPGRSTQLHLSADDTMEFSVNCDYQQPANVRIPRPVPTTHYLEQPE